jgi:ElaB/YqjD/DUF883 family membrane-anchored ribosome-binding protein
MSTVHNPTGQQYRGQQQHPSGTTGVGDTLRQAASSVGDAASSVAEKVENAWDSASGTVRDSAHYVSDRASDFWGDATDMVRRYPVTSVLIAFGLGCLAASLFRVPNWNDDVANRMSRSSM